MMWIRIIMIAFFSLTAMTLLSYQVVEIFHAFIDLYHRGQ